MSRENLFHCPDQGKREPELTVGPDLTLQEARATNNAAYPRYSLRDVKNITHRHHNGKHY
jgi:hypothetical protein